MTQYLWESPRLEIAPVDCLILEVVSAMALILAPVITLCITGPP